MVGNEPNAMFMNGAKSGQVIYLPDPPPERVTVSTMINLCHHRIEKDNPVLMVTYRVCEGSFQAGPLYVLITDDDTVGSAYYCMECKAEKEAKYGLRELRDKMNELLGEEEEQW